MRQDRLNKRLYNCKCINYGQIDPKKIEALRKMREKEMCTWKELSPFRDNDIKHEPRMGHHSTGTPMFPPITHLTIPHCAAEKSDADRVKEGKEARQKKKIYDSLPRLL